MQPEIESPKPTPPATPSRWEGWPTVGFGAAIFAVYFVAQSLVAVIFAVIYALRQFLANPGTDILQLVASLSTNGLLISVATIVSAIVGVGFIILFIKLRKGASIKDYLELYPITRKNTLIILAVVAGLIALSSLINYFFPQPRNEVFTVEAYKTSVWPPLLGVAVVIFAPAFEEGFFRGFLFVGLRQSRLGPIGTIALTSLAWALLHFQYDILGMANILILGIVFGTVRLKTGSLWSTLILHAIWNLIAIIGTALYVNGIGT